jgi:hypothetical protein
VLAEFALGPALFLLLYVIAGLGAVAAFWLVNLGESMGLVGASGAISGVMGMFAVLYGMRKVRFFYTVFVYFNFIMLPALVVLPYWIAWEVLQHFMSDSRVAYEAHAGGLVTGALLAFAVRSRMSQEATRDLDRPERDAQWDKRLQEGMDFMARLQFPRARSIFERLRAERPDDVRPLRQLFRIARAQPESEAFHRYAGELLAMGGPIESVFDEYWQAAKPSPRLDTALMIRLLNRFAAARDWPRADRLAQVMQNGRADPRVATTLEAFAKVRAAAPRG